MKRLVGEKVHRYTLLLILLLGVAVRMVFLLQPMRYDEAFSFTHYAGKPLSLGLSDYSFPNNHLFHTLLVHLAYVTFGNQPWVIRLPALVAGILLIPASYLFVRLFYNKEAGILTAGIIASSSILTEYSTNARGYTLVCLIFLLILCLAASVIRRQSLVAWMLISFLSVLGFYTIPIMLYPFVVVVVWLFLSILLADSATRRMALFWGLCVSFVATVVATFLLYAPVLASNGLESVIGNRFVAPKPWTDFVGQFPSSLLSVWNQWNRDVSWTMSILFAVGFFVSLVFHSRLSRFRVSVVIGVVLGVIPAIVAQRVVPYERVWLFLFPLYVGLASAGIILLFAFMAGEGFGQSLALPLLSLSLSIWLSVNTVRSQAVYFSNETGTLRDAEKITLFLKEYLRPGDRVLVGVPSDAILTYYFDLYGVPRDYLKSEMVSSKRIWIVVNESSHQTLTGFLDGIAPLLRDFTSPEILTRHESATIYQMDKIV